MKNFSFVFLLTLLGLENFTNNLIIKLLPLALLSLLAITNIFKNTNKNNFKIPIIITVFIFLIVIGIIRNNHPDTTLIFEFYRLYGFLLIIVTFIQTINSYKLNTANDLIKLFIWTIYIPLLGLISTNILGRIANVSSIRASEINLGDAVMLSQMGFSIERVIFPFSIGFNSYSVIVGITLLISLFGIRKFKTYRFIMLVGAIISIMTILLIDTRSALFYPILIFIFSMLFENKIQNTKTLYFIPLITIFGSTLLLTFLTIASQIPELSFLSRSSEDFETGNSRSLIWLISSMEFISFKLMHIIGYGEFGHYKSGASLQWANIFTQWGDSSDFITPHSVFYSILFDYGYIGLFFITIFQYKLLNKIIKNWDVNKSMSLISLSFIIYWNLIGITEAAFGFYTPNILILFILFSFFIYLQDHFLPIKRNKVFIEPYIANPSLAKENLKLEYTSIIAKH